jgi:hypothetical protein
LLAQDVNLRPPRDEPDGGSDAPIIVGALHVPAGRSPPHVRRTRLTRAGRDLSLDRLRWQKRKNWANAPFEWIGAVLRASDPRLRGDVDAYERWEAEPPSRRMWSSTGVAVGESTARPHPRRSDTHHSHLHAAAARRGIGLHTDDGAEPLPAGASLQPCRSSHWSTLTTHHSRPQHSLQMIGWPARPPLTSTGALSRSWRRTHLPTGGFGVRVPGGAPFRLVSGLHGRQVRRKRDENRRSGMRVKASACANASRRLSRFQETAHRLPLEKPFHQRDRSILASVLAGVRSAATPRSP